MATLTMKCQNKIRQNLAHVRAQCFQNNIIENVNAKMENNTPTPFAFNYRDIVVDEIALDGLEGIGLDLLWRRVEKRISSPVSDKMRVRFWKSIVNCSSISFYELPEPPPWIEIKDRYVIVDEETGLILDPPDYIDGPYEYNPVQDEYGSCVNYNTRVPIPRETLINLTYEEVVQKYGVLLVLVASIEERWHSLAPHMAISYLTQMTTVHFCILELVGRARENGQITFGKTNLTKIVKDAKLIFYNRKYLHELDLIRAQSINQIFAGKNTKSILLRLKRFDRPLLQTQPKVGKIHAIIHHLLQQPDYSSTAEEMCGAFSRLQLKKLKKFCAVLKFEPIPEEQIKYKRNKCIPNTKVTLNPDHDDSSQSDSEIAEEPLPCQYNVHISLMRQAYERFLEAGLKGLSQTELAQLLGIEFYTVRSICRVLKAKNIIREYLEDKGKQRIGRYVSTISAITEIDVKYEEEKLKFLGFLVANDSAVANQPAPPPPPTEQHTESDSEVPRKRIKLEQGVDDIDNMKFESFENSITEVSCIDGLENHENISLINSHKSPTLRQLKFANGIAKVMREKLVVIGYQTLSLFVAREINDTPMATKSLKLFVQKLVTDGQMKVLKMAWPGFPNKYSTLLCAPQVQPTDPIIRAKYKEINIRAIRFKKTKVPGPVSENPSKSISLFLYPRYMKIKLLHENIMKLVYFNDNETNQSGSPSGFSCLVDLLPELTLEFVLGHMSNGAVLETTRAMIPYDMYSKKLRNVPQEIFEMFLISQSLQNSIKSNLKVLAMFGLIQMIKDPIHNYEGILSYEFYVNRRAKIINTIGVWPREGADLQDLEKSYYFETYQDVESYWNDVYTISLSTKINLDRKTRARKNPVLPLSLATEVESRDNGRVLGDRTGPCGFDCSFYMESPRFWSAYYTEILKKHQLLQKKTVVKIPKLAKKAKKMVKPRPRAKRASKKKPISKPMKENKPLTPIQKKKREGATPKWSKEDDHIIMLCKAAITVLSPVAQTGCLMARNMAAKDILTISDPKKVATACHKRAITLESNTTLAYEKDCIINELKHRPHLIRQYEGMFKVLKIQHSAQMRKLISAARVLMLELVWIMYQLARSESYNQKQPCVAKNIEEFHELYEISPSSVNRHCNAYRSSLHSTPEESSIKEGVMVAVLSSFNTRQSAETATTIQTVFSPYPEASLRPVIEQLRRCGAVAVREKMMHGYLHKYNIQEIVHSSYKLAVMYQRKWLSRLNSSFVNSLVSIIDQELPQTGLKGNPEINCIMLELHTCDVLDIISESVPVITGSSTPLQDELLSAAEITMKYKLNSGTLGWSKKVNMQRCSDLYEHIDYEDALTILLKNSIVSSSSTSQNCDTENEIVSYLKEKKETGSTFAELLNISGLDSKTLTAKLSELESQNVIHRLGYYENLIVHTEFKQPWTLKIGDQMVIPTPWLTLDVDIRNDVLIKWSGEIVNEVFKNPGCSIQYLSDVCEFLTTRAVQDICILLEKCECVTLKCMKVPEPDLFSEDTMPKLEDYNQYESVENILVFPAIDTMVKFASMRKKMYHEFCEPVTYSP